MLKRTSFLASVARIPEKAMGGNRRAQSFESATFGGAWKLEVSHPVEKGDSVSPFHLSGLRVSSTYGGLRASVS